MQETKTRTRKAYDPGTPGEIRSEGHGRYVVESHTERGTHYSVDLTDLSCTCGDHIFRGNRACKHIIQAEGSSFFHAVSIARGLDAETLDRQAARNDLRPEVRAAIETVRAMNADRFQNAA